MTGTTLSHYRVLEKLGAGGMGEVYRAEDTTLGRHVAIKVLPDVFREDPERLARFEREAKVLVTAVSGTEGARMVFFSPDSQWLGYATATRLWKVARGGGQPIPICEVDGVLSAFWAEDDTIFFASFQHHSLARVNASGGVPQLVSRREGSREWIHGDPEVLPGGKALLFDTGDGGGGPYARPARVLDTGREERHFPAQLPPADRLGYHDRVAGQQPRGATVVELAGERIARGTVCR